MSKSKKGDFLFAKKVKSGTLESIDQTVYWLNGTGKIHGALMKMVANDKTRHDAWLQAVYMLASDEDGNRLYTTDEISLADFKETVQHSDARNYGMMILGVSKGDGISDFEMEVESEVKNSGKEKGTSNS